MPSATLPSQKFVPTSGEKFAGRYLLKEPLGEWGDTSAWSAEDKESGKMFALAFLPKIERLDAGGLNGLRREVRRSRQVIHPHIVRTHDLVEAEDGLAILMDMEPGHTLAKLLHDLPAKAYSVAEIKPWIGYLCQSLEDAHRAGLLHLDIRPGHLLIRPDGTLAILHFGIGRVIRDLAAAGSKPSRLEYTSPQILDGETPDASDDVYAAGAVVFELLTGAPPFTGNNVMADIRKTVPPMVGARRQELGIGTVPVPRHWDRVIAACLSKARAERPATAGQITSKLGVEMPGTEIPAIGEPGAETKPAPAVAPEKIQPAREAVPEARAAEKKAPEDTKQKPESRTEQRREEPQPKREPAPQKEWKPGTGTPSSKPAQSEKPDKPEKAGQFPRTAFIKDEDEHARKSGTPVAAIILAVIVLAVALVAYFAANKGGEKRGHGPTTISSAAPRPPATPSETDGQGGPTGGMQGKPEGVERTIENARETLEGALANFMSKEEASKKAAEAQRAVTGALAQVAVESRSAADRLMDAERKHEELLRSASSPMKEAEKTAIAKSEAQLKALRDAKETAEAALRALEERSNEARRAAERAAEELAGAEKEKEARHQQAGKQPETVTPGEEAADGSTLPPAETRAELLQPSVEAAPKVDGGDRIAARTDVQPPIPTVDPVSPTLTATPAPSPSASPAPEKKPDSGSESRKPAFENSLSMRFLPVGNVLFAENLTRLRDFETFANAGGIRSSAWRRPGFKQGPDHPVVNVSWEESIAFCAWLTNKEHESGVLPKDKVYRLPSDLEWSKAVGLPKESGSSPEFRDMAVADVYPWGNSWPPPPTAGNYTGEETGSEVAIRGFNDGFPWTSPVGSFQRNAFGLYDMGGNVWQWCMDWWNEDKKSKVLRGGSWYNGALKLSLLSSCRIHYSPGTITDNSGFRIVIAPRPETPRGSQAGIDR